MQRIILHIDMDHFFAQVEERENPQFKGKPIIIGADPKNGRGLNIIPKLALRD
jgi:nucleotidyltransferase/DNA polymerase involved in DNA repair